MKLTSSAFNDSQTIPQEFTCDGLNLSPPLEISGVPSGTQSLALILDDPDSPSGSFTHWILYNLKTDVTQLTQGQIPLGSLEGINSFGNLGYGGPCPHQGEHRYVFTLYALNTNLTLTQPKLAEFMSALHSHVLEKTTLTGRYQRSS